MRWFRWIEKPPAPKWPDLAYGLLLTLLVFAVVVALIVFFPSPSLEP